MTSGLIAGVLACMAGVTYVIYNLLTSLSEASNVDFVSDKVSFMEGSTSNGDESPFVSLVL